MPAQIQKGHTYAANATVSAENLGWLTASATVTLIDRSNVEKTNFTLITRDTAQPPGPYSGELWQDSTYPHKLLKSFRSSWGLAIPIGVAVELRSVSGTASQGTLLRSEWEGGADREGKYQVADATDDTHGSSSWPGTGETNVVAVSMETISPGATGFVAFHGVLPVIDDGTGSGVNAGVPVMLSDTVPGAAARRSGTGDADRLIGYALTQPGAGNLPSNMFWCKFFR